MIRIVIAEDQGMLLGAMNSLLSLEDDLEVVGMAKNAWWKKLFPRHARR